MARLPAALRSRMQALGHRQNDVVKATGVPQPQISKVLKGIRKRKTLAIEPLFQYAFNDLKGGASRDAGLTELFHRVVSQSPAAAECVRNILQSLVGFTGSSQAGKARKR